MRSVDENEEFDAITFDIVIIEGSGYIDSGKVAKWLGPYEYHAHLNSG